MATGSTVKKPKLLVKKALPPPSITLEEKIGNELEDNSDGSNFSSDSFEKRYGKFSSDDEYFKKLVKN